MSNRFITACIITALCATAPVTHAGGSCVVLKKLGNSLDLEWVTNPQLSQTQAVIQAKTVIGERHERQKYQDTHAQAGTQLAHGYLIVIKTTYRTFPDKDRTSYGCGFDARDFVGAETAAVSDLRTYSWAWKPGNGYDIVEQIRF